MDKINLQIETDDNDILFACTSYWEIDDDSKFVGTVKDLTKVLELTSKQFLNLIQTNCIAESTEIFCMDCETPYIYQSRSDYTEKQNSLNHYSNSWTCSDCKLERNRIEKQKKFEQIEKYRNLINQKYDLEPVVIDVNELSLEDAVYLISFIRLCANEDFSFAHPLTSATIQERLSPQTDFDYEIIRHLYRNKLIQVHPESAVEAFTGEEAETFYLDKVFWRLPVSSISGNTQDLVLEIEDVFRNEDFPKHWIDQRLELWRKIALQESLEYLLYSLQEHNMKFNPGDKTLLVINSLLNEFSVAQIYNIIWRCARDAAAFLVRTGVNKTHAANSIIGCMQRQGERAVAESWDTKSFNRNFNCPRTIISHVLFDAVLKIGESGFYKIPENENLPIENLLIDEVDRIQ